MKTLLGIAVALSIALPSSIALAQVGQSPFIFDPGLLGGVTAQWSPSIGCDRAPNDVLRRGLVLMKLGDTAEVKSAGTTFSGVNGKSLCGDGATLGFLYQPEGQCSGGAPRYNLTTKDDKSYFIGGCGNAIPTGPNNAGCLTVSFNVHDPAQAFPTPVPTSNSATDPACVIKSLSLIMDEGTDLGTGFAVVDEFNINGIIVHGPN